MSIHYFGHEYGMENANDRETDERAEWPHGAAARGVRRRKL